MPGAASGSWAMGEPHSEQKRRQTELPEEPLPSHFLTGPLMVRTSLGTTQTRASGERRVRKSAEYSREERVGIWLTVGGTALALAVVAVVVASEERLLNVSLVGDGLAETVSSKRHVGQII